MNFVRLALRQLARAATYVSTEELTCDPRAKTYRVNSAIYRGSCETELPAVAAAALRWSGSAGRPDRPSRAGRPGRSIPVLVTDRTDAGRTADARLPPVRKTVEITKQQTPKAAPTPSQPAKLLKIGHINIRSIATKLDDVWLLVRQNSLDILVISETWLTSQISDDILIFSGFKVFRADRKQPKPGRTQTRGGGLAFLVHEDVLATQLRLPTPPDSRLETMWLSVTAAGGRSAVVGGVYRPPDGSATADIDALQHQLLEVARYGRPWYLLGDTNLDLLRPEKPEVVA